MIIFKKITYKNFLSYGNNPAEIVLNQHGTTLISGFNGQGKCLHKSTIVEVNPDEEIKKLFEEFIMRNK